jgi:hypothetical protein
LSRSCREIERSVSLETVMVPPGSVCRPAQTL